ncbi:MAG: acyltransferase family protein [Azonexus sp.]
MVRAVGERRNLPEIDAAKGLAIILVVIGHVTPQDISIDWFYSVRSFIYGFHMPVFMYLSGYLFFMSGKHLLTGISFWRYLLARSNRLLLPFVVFGGLIIFGKHLMGSIIRVDDPVTDLIHSFQYLVIDTSHSPAQSIWFLVVLLFVSYITPLLFRYFGWWVIAFAAAIVFLPNWDFLYFNKFKSFYLFFWVGGVVAYHERWLNTVKIGMVSLCLFAISSYVYFGEEYRILPMGLFGALAIHFLIPYSGSYICQVLSFIGGRSMVIYLLNTIFIGVVKGGVFYFFSGVSSGLLLVVLIFSGVFLPLAFRWLLDKYPIFSSVSPYFR